MTQPFRNTAQNVTECGKIPHSRRSMSNSANSKFHCETGLIGFHRYVSILTRHTQFLVDSAVLAGVVPPRVTVRPSTQTLRPGDLFRVDCDAFDPLTDQQVRVEWSRDPRAAADQLSASATVDDGSLEIVSVTAADAGLYRCTALNDAGPTSAVVELVIFGQSHPRFTTAVSLPE